ncbi:MFS transporter [Spirochaetia bacterium]|nr:MFS transporter [Spirochaetia bacterium]
MPNILLLIVIYGDMALYGFLNSMKGVTFPLIKNSFQASHGDQGLMAAMVSFTAVIFCVISGIFMSRFGLKKTITTGFIVIGLGMGAIFFASGFWMAAVLYLIIQSGFGFFEIGLNGMGVRIFTVRSGLMLNLLHFFYGLGATIGPRFAGLIVNKSALSWQHIYPLALIPVFIMLVVSLIARYPGEVKNAQNETAVQNNGAEKKPSFLDALREPMVWTFGLILGVIGAIDGGSVAWSGLYLQDLYGMDPSTTGALFVSTFFVLYTLSRLLSGFVLEKFGYLNSLLCAALMIIVLYIAGFSLGRQGIWILPFTGIFIALVWPTILAISIGVFKERAQTMSSAIIGIAFTVSGIIQYGFGLTNRYIGEAWGYRSCVIYAAILAVMLFALKRKMHE